ncbi:MAG TPA: DUF2029 domain-containing protein [Candidatus Luteococcus avicola]|nr:DUF2029 domain-containing protein [Candidatus Luteococcus avicola]
MSAARHPDEVDLVALGARLLHSGWAWIAAWLFSRAVMLREWGLHYDYIANDVRYYYFQLAQGDPHVVLREYPLPVLWFLNLLRFPAAEDVNLYIITFALTMALLDAGFVYWLWRSHSHVAAISWMVFGFAMGPLVWFRYDMLPGVIVGAAVLFIARRPRVSGALVAVGAGIKLWPALLIAPLLGRDQASLRRTTSCAATGLALALLALVDAGAVRLVSPLSWQSDRGLQIESVWATPMMWKRAFGTNPQVLVEMSRFNAYELFGPGVGGYQLAASIAMVIAVVFCVVVAVAALARTHVPAHERAQACAAIVSMMLVANKTLSPQYLIWYGAVCSAWLALSPRTHRLRAMASCGAGLVVAAATQYVYPVAYGGLITNPVGEVGVTAVLALRNLLLTVVCLTQAVWVAGDLAAGLSPAARRWGRKVESTDSIPPG